MALLAAVSACMMRVLTLYILHSALVIQLKASKTRIQQNTEIKMNIAQPKNTMVEPWGFAVCNTLNRYVGQQV